MTDHAAETAMSYLAATVIDTHGDDDRKVAIAQVHATLALADEQRTANQLAWLIYRQQGGTIPVGEPGAAALAARLGLTPTTPAVFDDSASHALDDTPCSTCGGDRLRPDFSKPGQPCHITPTTPNQEQNR